MDISIVLLLILIVFQIIISLMDARDVKKLIGTDITEKVRINFYKGAIIWGWVPVVIIALFVAFTSATWHDMGIRKVLLSDFKWLNIAVLGIAGVVAVLQVYQAIMYLLSEKYRKEIAAVLEDKMNSGNHYDRVTLCLLTPHTLKEKVYFFFVSVTAGICEEIHFRGCLMFLLSNVLPNAHIGAIGVIAALLFGLFHCYQGFSGVIKTGVVGMIFVLLYLVTDSLVPGILLHFWIDYSNAFLIREER
ncbi:MAG: CPBP family intramembrane metalloprotease [Clostridia bacterium]|nr:CPBP family intramembrane metalloprotease [Clostridia bacterium]